MCLSRVGSARRGLVGRAVISDDIRNREGSFEVAKAVVEGLCFPDRNGRTGNCSAVF